MQFSLKELLVVISLVAVSFALAAGEMSGDDELTSRQCWLLSGIVLGGTIGCVIGRRWKHPIVGTVVGAFLGLAIQFFSYFLLPGRKLLVS